MDVFVGITLCDLTNLNFKGTEEEEMFWNLSWFQKVSFFQF